MYNESLTRPGEINTYQAHSLDFATIIPMYMRLTNELKTIEVLDKNGPTTVVVFKHTQRIHVANCFKYHAQASSISNM